MDNNDIVLNGSTATWTLLPTQGEVLGTYAGTFQFKCYLTPIQTLEAGREFRSFLGSFSGQATETESNISFALSQLKFRVISAPPFWESTKPETGYAGNIPDLNILSTILDASIRAEDMFKEKVAKDREAILNRSINVAEIGRAHV